MFLYIIKLINTNPMKIHSKKTLLPIVGVLLLAIFVTSCGGSDSESNSAREDLLNDSSDDRLNKAKDMLYLVPSPIETVMLLHRAGASYDGQALNRVDNMSKYETKMEKSLNLGIYGADLSYASMFDMTQDAMFYVQACKNLAEGLGIMNAFDEATIARMEENINDRDSMLRIISDTYWIADSYLKENESVSTSAMIVAGGWIEALHIATSVAKNSKNSEDMVQRIGEQKYALDNLVALLSSYEQTDDIKAVYTDMMLIKSEFDKLEVISVDSEDSIDPKTGVTTVGETYKIIITPQQFNDISAKLNTVRNKYIE